MREVIGFIFLCMAGASLANQQIIASEGDTQTPQVELNIPEKPKTPLIENYRTEDGNVASVVTPDEGNSYFVVSPQQAYQTQYPQEREADVPINDSNWVLISW